MSERMVGIVPEHLAPPGMRNNGIVLDHCRDLIARAQLGEYVPPDRLALAQSMLRRAESRKTEAVEA